jgi:hypothetical protein
VVRSAAAGLASGSSSSTFRSSMMVAGFDEGEGPGMGRGYPGAFACPLWHRSRSARCPRPVRCGPSAAPAPARLQPCLSPLTTHPSCFSASVCSPPPVDAAADSELPTDYRYAWAQESYSRRRRALDTWTFVLALRARLWLLDQAWSYPGGKSEEARGARARATAVWIRERILQLGPTFIKLGQLFSTRSDLFPQEFTQELSKLQVRRTLGAALTPARGVLRWQIGVALWVLGVPRQPPLPPRAPASTLACCFLPPCIPLPPQTHTHTHTCPPPRTCQDRVPAFSADKAEAIIERELGAPVGRLFAAFDRRPIAAASLGQVHRARLHSGEDVVVKVQRPGLRQLFEIDLENLEKVAEALDRGDEATRDFRGIYKVRQAAPRGMVGGAARRVCGAGWEREGDAWMRPAGSNACQHAMLLALQHSPCLLCSSRAPPCPASPLCHPSTLTLTTTHRDRIPPPPVRPFFPPAPGVRRHPVPGDRLHQRGAQRRPLPPQLPGAGLGEGAARVLAVLVSRHPQYCQPAPPPHRGTHPAGACVSRPAANRPLQWFAIPVRCRPSPFPSPVGLLSALPCCRYTPAPPPPPPSSSPCVLTLEYAPGTKITDVEGIRAAGLDCTRVAQRATESYLIQILRHGFFHAGGPLNPGGSCSRGEGLGSNR